MRSFVSRICCRLHNTVSRRAAVPPPPPQDRVNKISVMPAIVGTGGGGSAYSPQTERTDHGVSAAIEEEKDGKWMEQEGAEEWPTSAAIKRPGTVTFTPSPMFRFGLRLEAAPCRVIKVYDGDSVTVAWQAWQVEERRKVFLYANCRMYGYDTPEMNSAVPSQKEMAQECKRLVADLLLDERMRMTTVGKTGLDKYGRPLIELRIDPRFTSLRAQSILSGHETVRAWALQNLPGCKPYFGGTKEVDP